MGHGDSLAPATGISRREFCAGLVGTAALALSPRLLARGLSPARDGNEPPNVLLILADDLGYEMLGCYGGLEIETPQLDRLAAGGVRFARAYASPVCTPSRMSLYTGTYVPRHGHYGVLPIHKGYQGAIDFAHTWPTYAQSLHAAGYQTSVTGKWQLGAMQQHPNHPRTAGFDSWCVWQIMTDGEKTSRYWDNPCYNRDGKVMKGIEDRYGPHVLVDYVIERMAKAKKEGKPFLIHHNENLPHFPVHLTPPDKAAGRTKPGKYHMMRYMDTLVGKLLDGLDELGIADNTLVIFAGDNGSDLGGVRRTKAGPVTGGKFRLNDGGTHVPLIARWPARIKAGRTADDLVEFADFFPTVCQVAGGEPVVPKGFTLDGKSFAEPLLGTGPGPREVVTAGGLFAFDGQWRLHPNGKLFDCRKLPAESEAADDPEAQAARKRLQPVIDNFKQIKKDGKAYKARKRREQKGRETKRQDA